MNIEGDRIRYKESWRICKCGSRIVFNANLPCKIPELCNRCQKIADMKQTTINEWSEEQKTIEHFNGEQYEKNTNNSTKKST